MDKKETDLHIGNGSFMNIKTSQNVKLYEQFIIYNDEGPVSLNVEITADFAQIDEKYHEIFFNVLSSKYLNKVTFSDNPFSLCKSIEKRKWYQLWKPKK
jgi:hypothetical protein